MSRHVALDNQQIDQHQLLIGNQTLQNLALRAGRTPFYAYDRSLISQRVSALRAALPACIELHYAIKANPMPAVVDWLAGLVDGLDVASLGELQTALNSGMPASEISFAGPAKQPAELAAAIASGVLINVESPDELHRIEQLCEQLQLPARIALRVNPDFELKSAGMKMSGGAKPFGIDSEQVTILIEELRDHPRLHLEGLHIFSGSQNLRLEAIQECQQRTLELARRLTEAHGKPLHSINLGGGLGIPYFPGEQTLPLAQLGENMAQLLQEHRDWLADTRLVMELGRYLVGEAGYYVCRVLERKHSRGQTFLMCDGGLHHHLSNSGNFGQVLRRNYPVLVGNRADQPAEEAVSIHGPLCTPLDIIAERIELPRAEAGDWIVVLQSGAYGASASPAAFLGHPPAVELLV